MFAFITRFYFFWTIVAISKNFNDSIINSDTFAFVNLFLFGLTNGIITSIILTLL